MNKKFKTPKIELEHENKTVCVNVPKGDFCTTSMSWSHYEKCQFLDTNFPNPFCWLHGESVDKIHYDHKNIDIEGTYVLKCKKCSEPSDKKLNASQSDKFFITEIINDLHRNGHVPGGKAETMLHDWARELKEKSNHPPSRLKKEFSESVGIQNW